jgi:hypothetical protein
VTPREPLVETLQYSTDPKSINPCRIPGNVFFVALSAWAGQVSQLSRREHDHECVFASFFPNHDMLYWFNMLECMSIAIL